MGNTLTRVTTAPQVAPQPSPPGESVACGNDGRPLLARSARWGGLHPLIPPKGGQKGGVGGRPRSGRLPPQLHSEMDLWCKPP